MEPIISPWLIYMLPLVNTFIAIMATVSLCTLTILLIVYVDIDFVRYRGAKAVKATWVLFIISSLLAIFTPTKETLIAMYIANHATPENIQMLINTFIK